MGLHTGFVVVGAIGDNLRIDYTAIGDTTNLAARLQQVADPGAIVMSEATARLVEGDVEVESLGPVMLKGRSESMSIVKVVGRGAEAAAEYAEALEVLEPVSPRPPGREVRESFGRTESMREARGGNPVTEGQSACLRSGTTGDAPGTGGRPARSRGTRDYVPAGSRTARRECRPPGAAGLGDPLEPRRDVGLRRRHGRAKARGLTRTEVVGGCRFVAPGRGGVLLCTTRAPVGRIGRRDGVE
jgi:hypothetical protein